MMTLPQDEVPPPSSRNSTALVLRDERQLSASHSDLELHLLQTFAAFAAQQLTASYLSVKHASRLTKFLAEMTESLASRTGLASLVKLLFHQYKRLGHPIVQHVDDAMGKRVIDAVVSILLLAEQTDKHTGILALEAEPNCSDSEAKLSYAERFQALLLGEVPRMEQMLLDARRQAREEAQAEAEKARLVMDLEDFVPVDEVARLQEEKKRQLDQAADDAARLKAQLEELTREKQKLEQRLTDVHNYQESERGRRFQDMEDELTRTKLEAHQKTHELRKLEILVETLQRRRKSKSASRKGDNQSNASESAPPSPSPEHKKKSPKH